jgi:hypothetical protein
MSARKRHAQSGTDRVHTNCDEARKKPQNVAHSLKGIRVDHIHDVVGRVLAVERVTL